MTTGSDYFVNHARKLRFPWSLYHAPIVRELARAIAETPGRDVLNVGAGPFLERERLPADRRYAICDLDPRAIAAARERHGPALTRADVLADGLRLPYGDGAFDLVASTEVIEHVEMPARWLAEIARVTRAGGRVFVTTPNYASRSFLLLEATVLEAIARASGFSRRHLHPTKLDASRLRRLLEAAGLVPLDVRTIACGWVVSAHARKPGP
jgi:SAM-dependent methyltransferase